MAGKLSAGAVGAVAVVSAAAALFTVTVLQHDFAAYWVAGMARRLGLDPYVNHVGLPPAPALWDGVAPFRHSRFLYPPLVADLFRPLALFPFRLAKALFTGASLAAWVGAAALLASITGARRDLARLLIAGALFFPVYLALERGQIDLLLLVLLLAAWRLAGRPAAAGALLALAAAVKPALLALLPALWMLGHRRWVSATVGWAAAIIAATAIVSGPALLRGYAAGVLPRAALYGEGGTEDHLLPEDRLPPDDHQHVTVDGHAYRRSLSEVAPWTITTSASLPRLLAPEAPSGPATVAPLAIATIGLAWAARRRARRSSDDRGAFLVYLAAAVACVVISPAGWAMGLVWGLPIVPVALGLRDDGRVEPRRGGALAAAFIACAVPAPFAGWPALAGAALVVATCAVVLGEPPARGQPA